MTSLPTAYTPLESLLLFQALRFESPTSHSVFNRISEQLKSIRLVTSDPKYDPGRLSPDALRETYLWLLKEEAKRDLDDKIDDESLLQNGDASPGSRKRKAPSSSLPSVHEAAQHEHLIPQLVTRLYRSYREHAVKEIREHERRYDAVKREIEEIEIGKWDERLQRQRNASATQSPRPSTSAHTQPLLEKQEHIRSSNAATASPKSPQKTLDSSTQTPKPYAQNKIDALINHGPEPQTGVNNHRRTSSTTTLPPLSEMAPRSPQFGIPPTIPAPGQAYGQPPINAHQSPYVTQHGHAGPLASPQVQSSLSRPGSSDRPILPPPPGMKLPPPSPGSHPGSPGLRGPPIPPQQQYQTQPRLPSGLSPSHDRGGPPTYASSQMPSTPAGYYQQQPYLDRRTSYPPQQQQAASAYSISAHHPGGYPVTPFPVDPQSMGNGQQGQVGMQQYSHPTMSQQSPVYAQWNQMRGQPPNQSLPATAPRPVRPPNNRVVSDIIAALATPPRMTQKPLWRIETDPRRMASAGGTPLPRPEVEPLSPILKRSETAPRPTRSMRTRDAGTAEHSEDPDSILKSSRRRPKRDRSPHSVVSSIADESARMTRSQSVSTPLATLAPSDERPMSRGKVKAEPSTPAGFTEDGDATQELPSGGAIMTRKRRGTLQSQPLQPPPKRKRQHSPNGADRVASEEWGTPPPKPTTVLASRNFHKTSATIMNDINSHKHASYFTTAVRDKDAPGYSEIIKQPQNLKSIRTAIAAGNRAVNAATSVLDSPSAAGTPTGSMSKSVADGSTIVELDRTIDLVPPKAIVNGAQLEKEVMRIFANAVMFNPGEDGMVSITREMFDEVDAKIQEWRGAEKEAAENEAEDEGKGKRRKLL